MPDALPFHSPLRPTLGNGLPAYPTVKPMAALPRLHVEPAPNGFHVSVWLLIEPNVAREFHKYLQNALEVGWLCKQYALDPERVMVEQFLWPGLSASKPPPSPHSDFSLAELGL